MKISLIWVEKLVLIRLKILALFLTVLRYVKRVFGVKILNVSLDIVIKLGSTFSVYFPPWPSQSTLIFQIGYGSWTIFPQEICLSLDFCLFFEFKFRKPILLTNWESILVTTQLFSWKNKECLGFCGQDCAGGVFGQDCST